MEILPQNKTEKWNANMQSTAHCKHSLRRCGATAEYQPLYSRIRFIGMFIRHKLKHFKALWLPVKSTEVYFRGNCTRCVLFEDLLAPVKRISRRVHIYFCLLIYLFICLNIYLYLSMWFRNMVPGHVFRCINILFISKILKSLRFFHSK